MGWAQPHPNMALLALLALQALALARDDAADGAVRECRWAHDECRRPRSPKGVQARLAIRQVGQCEWSTCVRVIACPCECSLLSTCVCVCARRSGVYK